MKLNKKSTIVLIACIVIGAFMGWNFSNPLWDDTGISAGLVFGIAFLASFISTEKPWLWAITIAIWIPFFDIITNSNYNSLIAFIPAILGAYIGYFIKKMI